jgi:hypothetical protein
LTAERIGEPAMNLQKELRHRPEDVDDPVLLEVVIRPAMEAAQFAKMDPSRLQQVLLTHYPPGAAIGWHKDRSVFGQAVGISLLSACNFRFKSGRGVRSMLRRGLPICSTARPGTSEHSVPPVEAYAIPSRSGICVKDERSDCRWEPHARPKR